MIGTRRHTNLASKGEAIRITAILMLVAGAGCCAISASAQQPGQRTFSSAMEASKKLVEAMKADDQPELLKILGPDAKAILSSGDQAEDKGDRDDFIQKYQKMHRLVNEPDGMTTLYIGPENWPMPIPLAKKNGTWYFDTPAGKNEILYRRIGKNELSVIQLCHELVDAQREYYAQPHDGDAGRHYAQKVFSDSDKHNGLYWKPASGEGDSPIGPLVAAAAGDGAVQKREPFQGYYFRLLSGPPAKTKGNAQGFVFLAYPAEYRASGVMSFLVDQDGIVYEKDFGPRTAEIANAIALTNRDATWHQVE
jgi:hypothetical protein